MQGYTPPSGSRLWIRPQTMDFARMMEVLLHTARRVLTQHGWHTRVFVGNHGRGESSLIRDVASGQLLVIVRVVNKASELAIRIPNLAAHLFKNEYMELWREQRSQTPHEARIVPLTQQAPFEDARKEVKSRRHEEYMQ